MLVVTFKKFDPHELAEVFGTGRGTIRKRIAQGIVFRILDKEKDAFDYPHIHKRSKKLDPKIVSEIAMFVDNHEHVGFSPNMNDMLKVKGSDE